MAARTMVMRPTVLQRSTMPNEFGRKDGRCPMVSMRCARAQAGVHGAKTFDFQSTSMVAALSIMIDRKSNQVKEEA